MSKLTPYVTLLLLCLLGIASLPVQAAITIESTRIIYPAQSRDTTVKITNTSTKTPRLVQVWLDKGDATVSAEKSDVPFIMSPPVFRLEPNAAQTVRLSYTKEPLATDKETIFWFNALEIPPTLAEYQDENQLNFSFRLRLKVFFRPANLPIGPAAAPEKLLWSLVKDEHGSALEVQNPTPYYVSLQQVALVVGDKSYASKIAGPLSAPGETQRFALKENVPGTPSKNAKVQFTSVDDFGAFIPATALLSNTIPAPSASATKP